jgi:two-component system, cell cycle response regulator CtrA
VRILYAGLFEPPDVETLLRLEGFNVYSTDVGEEAIDLGKMYDYDLIVLRPDIMNMTGMDVLRQLRLAKCKTPVLMLGHLSGAPRVLALNAGADDFLYVSDSDFHPPELTARIHAITRRSKGHAESLVTVGALCVNLNTKTVAVSGRPLALTGKEYAMLELLALRKGSLITKDMFLNHLYGGMDEPEIKIIDVFICKLRRKLANATEDGSGWGLIETVWGRGYILRDSGAAVESPTLAPELQERAADTGVDFVPQKTWAEVQAERDRRVASKIKSPSLVPALGQK